MTIFLIVLHVLVCSFLILFVLLQPGARGGVGAAFGGAGGATVFGGRGANTFLAKLTGAAAIIFMMTSISLSYFVSKSSSVMKARVPAATTTTDDAKATDDAKTAGDEKKDADSGLKIAPATDSPPAAPVGEPPPAP
jgi:preprotein translocase subunit SecG